MKTLLAITLSAILSLFAFSLPVQRTDVILAFRHVDVFDGSRMIRRTNVLVREGMIRAVGPDVIIPPAAQIVDGRGRPSCPDSLTRTRISV